MTTEKKKKKTQRIQNENTSLWEYSKTTADNEIVCGPTDVHYGCVFENDFDRRHDKFSTSKQSRQGTILSVYADKKMKKKMSVLP